LNLAQGLVIAGKLDEAEHYFNAAIDLAPDAQFANQLTAYKAAQIADLALLSNPSLSMSAELRAALLQGYRAREAQDAGTRAQAVKALVALAENDQREAVARLLADLGANHEAFKVAARLATTRERPGPSIFWDRKLRSTLADPDFPAVATQLGLFNYWKTTRTRPDVCLEKEAPPFCKTL